MERNPAVYLLASRRGGVLYTGVTSALLQRIWQHRTHQVPGFTERYNIHRLVWFEQCLEMEEAILREKRLKRWRREWKIALIEATNPEWQDLYHQLIE